MRHSGFRLLCLKL